MNIDDVKLNTMTLEELEKVQELLDERIGIIKGRASFKTEKLIQLKKQNNIYKNV